jgi:cytochrome o ubiquinol oxidase subunit 2
MSAKIKAFLFAGALIVVTGAAFFYLKNADILVLEPAGPIAQKERNLIFLAVGLSLIVVIPVYFMLIYFPYKYRHSNKKAAYAPNLDGNRWLEFTWWAVPFVIIFILAIATYKGSVDLDPAKPIASHNQPLTIQVVALQWKWLFIYPKQGIASVNYVQFPQNVPIEFQITADAPMNAFWIPQLGSQIYAMSGMSTRLHLMAKQVGDYYGSSSNISGEGFADMKFLARSTTSDDFEKWVKNVRRSPDELTIATYNQLAKPTRKNSVAFFSFVESTLYQRILNKYVGY